MGSLLLGLAVIQLRAATIPPEIAREWVLAVGTGLRASDLVIDSRGKFRLESTPTKGPIDKMSGSIAVSPIKAELAKGGLKHAMQVTILIETMNGFPAPKQGAGAPALRLYFVPEVPVLTDIMTIHMVPKKGRALAMKRLAKWKPF